MSEKPADARRKQTHQGTPRPHQQQRRKWLSRLRQRAQKPGTLGRVGASAPCPQRPAELAARACSRLRLAAFAQRVIVRRKRLQLHFVEPAKGAVAKERDKQAFARRPRGAGSLAGAVRVGYLPRPARVALHARPHQVAA